MGVVMSRWQDFNFPELALSPVAKGARGLCAALEERRIADRLPEDYEFEPEYFSSMSNGRSWARSFDSDLRGVAQNYVLVDEELPEDDKERYRTATLEDMAELLGEDLIDPSSRATLLYPEWSRKWALQRYRMINLLKLHKVPANLTGSYMSGSEHTGEPMSPNAAVSAALSDAEKRENIPVRLERTFESIYGPHHGWKEGSYCANVYLVGDVRLDVEDLKDEEGNLPERMVICVEVSSPFNDESKFDAFGTGLSLGVNFVDVAPDGTLFSWELPANPDKTHSLPGLVDTTFGFYGSCFAIADVSSRFDFYDESED